MNDAKYMKIALQLAEAAKGQTSPNPVVGAVVVKDGEILGMGAHLQPGLPHAEVHALEQAGDRAEGADLYVTLEPCCHQGRTPPCTELIIDRKIRRVIVASQDPNPQVAGKGMDGLKRAGILVDMGICRQEADALNESFFHFIQHQTPFVTLKAAISLDGKTAAKTGDSKWITSPESRLDVHRLRHTHDAILIGVNTVLKDNPQLTTRLPQGGKNPIRIVLDTDLKTPVDANIIQDQAVKTIIFTGKEICPQKVEQIRQAGVEVHALSRKKIHIEEVLKELGKRQIMSLLVEGGSEIHASFVQKIAFQRLIVYLAPKIIGGKGAVPFIGGTGIDFVHEALELEWLETERIGPDLKLTARPLKEE